MHNEAARADPAEVVEGRELATGQAVEPTRGRRQRRDPRSRALDRIGQAARRDRARRLTARWHHVDDIDRLREADDGLKREAAAGGAGRPGAAYGEDLAATRRELSDRLERGAYHGPAVERVAIPQPDGRQRPLGLPPLADKSVQRATGAVLNAIAEGAFRGFSSGCRPGRRPHEAVEAAPGGREKRTVNGVFEADIRGFLEAIGHAWLVPFMAQRRGDQRVVRHGHKWLNAGVLEEGPWRAQEAGRPQGGHGSPVAAPIDRQDVLEVGAERWRRRSAHGAGLIVRDGDDGARPKPLLLWDERSPPRECPDSPEESGSRHGRVTGHVVADRQTSAKAPP